MSRGIRMQLMFWLQGLSLYSICLAKAVEQVGSLSSVYRHPTIELSTLSSETFTIFSHSVFPGRSARIKKSLFCDGGVNSYTGYIDIGQKHLFFYFFESRGDPGSDEVLLWTNGGPGGSSATGLFMELGPCNILSPNSTEFNPYSWNQNANIFFIDQPVGVGFSYHDLGEGYGASTSEKAGADIAAFVAMFFETFDSFKGRRFHLTGESYAGRYLPVYAAALHDQNEYLVEKGLTPINFDSVMIGNGATDYFGLLRSHYDFQCNSEAGLEAPVQPISTCVRMKEALPRCTKMQLDACIDHFDVMDCGAAFNYCRDELMMPYAAAGYNFYDITMRCSSSVNCYPEMQFIIEYLNSASVRQILGIDAAFDNFSSSSSDVSSRFFASGDPFHLTQLYVAELLARGVRILIYVGTNDFIANWVGNERWTLEMEWLGQTTFASAPLLDWSIDEGKSAVGKTRSSGNFTFATIYGAGHFVPHDKPIEALSMEQKWLAHKAF